MQTCLISQNPISAFQHLNPGDTALVRTGRNEELAHLLAFMEKSLHHILTWTAALNLWHSLKKEIKWSVFKHIFSMF